MRTKDGIEVYLHPQESHPHRPELVEEALSKIEIGDRGFVRDVVDFGRTIGKDHLVEITDADKIVPLDRYDSGYESRMVLGREPEDTSKATAIIAKCGPEDGEEWDGKYVLVTLFEGDPGMPEPYGRNENNQEAIAFWKNHALVPTDDEMKKINEKMAEKDFKPNSFEELMGHIAEKYGGAEKSNKTDTEKTQKKSNFNPGDNR